MKFQVKVQNGNCKFVKFYIEADIVDGIVRFLSEEPVVACDITVIKYFVDTIQGRRYIVTIIRI